MRFVDEAKIRVKAGDGGAGIIAWRREKFVPLGGPAGGNGGKGGDVIFVAKEGMSSLLDLKKQWLVSADDGQKGQSKNKAGRKGRDKVICVPVGTVISEKDTQNTREFDLTKHNAQIVVCVGGDGGFGNTHFKTQLNNAPERATAGHAGEVRDLELTLKLMADVGLLGFPNAGKSTLLSRLSNAKPKIASYPFTTIKPMVGVCEIDWDTSLVIADIPGLIEGAHQGHGLGMRFLRHLERVRVMCHLIDATQDDNLVSKFEIINAELEKFNNNFKDTPQVVVISKIDSVENTDKVTQLENYLKNRDIASLRISSVSGQGLDKLKNILVDRVKLEKEPSTGNKSKFNPVQYLY